MLQDAAVPAISGMVNAATRDAKRQGSGAAPPAIDRAGAVPGNAHGSRTGIASGLVERALPEQAGNRSPNLRVQIGYRPTSIGAHGVKMRARASIAISILIWTAYGEAFAVQPAPTGHRQPNASNVPASVLRAEQGKKAEDIELNKKLNICRGC